MAVRQPSVLLGRSEGHTRNNTVPEPNPLESRAGLSNVAGRVASRVIDLLMLRLIRMGSLIVRSYECVIIVRPYCAATNLQAMLFR